MGFPILVRWHLYIESGPCCDAKWGHTTWSTLSCVTTAKTVQCPAITWVCDVLVSVEHTGANFSEIWNEILSEKISFKMSSARWQPLWLIHNVLWYDKSSDSKNEEFWLDFTCEEKSKLWIGYLVSYASFMEFCQFLLWNQSFGRFANRLIWIMVCCTVLFE